MIGSLVHSLLSRPAEPGAEGEREVLPAEQVNTEGSSLCQKWQRAAAAAASQAAGPQGCKANVSSIAKGKGKCHKPNPAVQRNLEAVVWFAVRSGGRQSKNLKEGESPGGPAADS